MNISGTVNVLRILFQPSLCLPHATVTTFRDLPIPLNRAFTSRIDVKAVVLDKDNCFAKPHENVVHEPYSETFQQLRKAYPGSRLLIVSNTAGTAGDRNKAEAALLERNTGVKVFHHDIKKPGCGKEIFNYFRHEPEVQVTVPSQIVVIGDRLFTDILMANMFGFRSIWIKDGVVGNKSFWARVEQRLESFLTQRGYRPPDVDG
ncbi:MAG: hypothetical protein M1820_001004 [Bogoriella megaspora]|nr:MAG: hypothetical protein M1820_001004 [Bogoriella megaspora]